MPTQSSRHEPLAAQQLVESILPGPPDLGPGAPNPLPLSGGPRSLRYSRRACPPHGRGRSLGTRTGARRRPRATTRASPAPPPRGRLAATWTRRAPPPRFWAVGPRWRRLHRPERGLRPGPRAAADQVAQITGRRRADPERECVVASQVPEGEGDPAAGRAPQDTRDTPRPLPPTGRSP